MGVGCFLFVLVVCGLYNIDWGRRLAGGLLDLSVYTVRRGVLLDVVGTLWLIFWA